MTETKRGLARRDLLRAGAALSAAPVLMGASSSPFTFNRRLPDELHKKIKELAPHGITAIGVTPGGGWSIAAGARKSFSRNVPDACYQQIRSFSASGRIINCIAFPPGPGDGWLVATDESTRWSNLPGECESRLRRLINRGRKIKHVAFPPTGENRWLIITDSGFFARKIDDQLYQILRNYKAGKTEIRRVVFGANNSWVLLATDGVQSRGIDAELSNKLLSMQTQRKLPMEVTLYPATQGWSAYASGRGVRPPTRMRQFEQSVDLARGSLKRTSTNISIYGRMKAQQVPGVAIALIRGNRLDWAGGYGVLEDQRSDAIHPETHFQVASVSKAVAGLGVYRLVQETRGLALDDEIDQHIAWNIPRRAACANFQGKPTIRDMLMHTSGIIGRGTTFPVNQCRGLTQGRGGSAGHYPLSVRGVPSIDQIKNGNTTNTTGDTIPRFEYVRSPGTYSYSGQGYTVLQHLIEEVSGLSFDDYMLTKILQPLGMTESTFSQNYPASWRRDQQLAQGHDGGKVTSPRVRLYPESAAAGMRSTVLDLAKFVIELNVGAEKGGQILGKSAMIDMIRNSSLNGNDSLSSTLGPYSHGGRQNGFRSMIRGYPNEKGGYVILTNASGPRNAVGAALLTQELEDTLQRVYGWA